MAFSNAEINKFIIGRKFVRKKFSLDTAITKLKLLEENFLSNQYCIEDDFEIVQFKEKCDNII